MDHIIYNYIVTYKTFISTIPPAVDTAAHGKGGGGGK